MTANGHGGNVHAASRELKQDLDRLVDFSASINPLGPSRAVRQAVSKACDDLRHYPDPECWVLRRALASRWKRHPEEIVVGNGSIELIHALPRALGLRRLLVVGPTFSEYAAAMTRCGGQITTVLANRDQQYAPPLEHVLHLVQRRHGSSARKDEAIVLCHPNSPTGQACEVDAVMQMVLAAERRKLWTIIDETFAEYCEEQSILRRVTGFKRVIVLRSLTKFYGLPGLRVGYALSTAEVVRRLARHLPPWSVNAVAQAAAVAALNDVPHAERSLSFMRRERARFTTLLQSLPGCVVFPSRVNFILMEVPEGWHAATVTAKLRRKGILIRDCSNMPGLHTRSIRLAVRTSEENDRLVRELSGLFRREKK
jgi:threonine-phosphate decarboxylase